jgi:hypothetical protein
VPLPEYRYGKVTGLVPDLTVTSERSESPMVCCGYCSAQMAARTAKAGVSALMTNEAHAIRRAGGRPHNNGNRAGELIIGAKEALNVTLRSVAIDDIPQRLKDGFAVVAGVQYADLADWLKVQTNDFGHAVCLFGWQAGDQAGFFDPLWTQGARGAWTPWSTIKRALWPNGNHSTTTVKLVAGGTDVGIFFNPARWKATKDIAVYLDSACTQKITTIKAGVEFSTLGEKAAVDSNGWTSSARAVRVMTGGLIPGSDDKAEEAILWAKGADFPPSSIKTSSEWDLSIWSLMGDINGRYPAPPSPTNPPPDDVIKARDALWEEALRGGLPWPKSE